MYTLVIAEQCRRRLDRVVLAEHIEELRSGLKAIDADAPLPRQWTSRPPLWVNSIAGWALIAVLRAIDGHKVLCIVDVVNEQSGDYGTLMRNPRGARLVIPDDTELAAALELENDDEIQEREPIPDEWWSWLTAPGWAIDEDNTSSAVYESPVWVQMFRREEINAYWQDYYSLLFDVIAGEAVGTPSELPPAELLMGDRLGLLFRRFRPDGSDRREVIFLLAPLRAEGGVIDQSVAAIGNSGVLALPDDADFSEIARHAERAYPDYLLGEREAWRAVQNGHETNLALSPEEEATLAELSTPRETSNLPVFLNGRAGSGKSTLLYYLFADYCDRKLEEDLPGTPLFVTYSERLVETAQRSVTNLLTFHHRFLEHRGLREEADAEPAIGGFFHGFRELLIELIDDADRDRHRPENHVSFYRFSQLYLGRPLHGGSTHVATRRYERELALNPNREMKWSPELCWHVLRTFIKGYQPSGYLTPEEYASVPRRERVVTDETFAAIYDEIWTRWYAHFSDHGLWDDQDLVRAALPAASPAANDHEFSAIFCDEAQDFTRLELRLIMQLSRLTSFDLGRHSPINLPFGFAGDPFQTLNPTGFRWAACQAAFKEVVVDTVDPGHRYALSLHARELLFNYRSTPPIVRVTNLIQLWRHVLFGHEDLRPQQWWGHGGFPQPEKFIIGQNLPPESLRQINDTIVIVPCEEGQEHQYVRRDPALASALDATDSAQAPKNVLSAVAAKGLEFRRVVLYKFGDACPELVWERAADGHDEHPGEDTLSAEYFFNKLYVGATRAKESMFVIDTARGDQRLWRHATLAGVEQAVSLADTPDVWGSFVAALGDGDDPSVMSERDPAAIAAEFYAKGKTAQNPEHLRRAAGFFTSAGRPQDALRSEALAHRFEGDFAGAGRLFEELALYGDAWSAYWEGRCWTELSAYYEREQTIPGVGKNDFEMARDVTRFMVADPVAAEPVVAFAAELSTWGESIGGGFSQQWRTAVKTLEERARALAPDAVDDTAWLEIATALEGADDRGHRTRSAAGWCYHHAGYPGDAARCWTHAGDTEHPEYFRTKAQLAEGVAEKLRWLARLPTDEQTEPILAVWEEGRESIDPRLGRFVADVVAPALERAAADVADREAVGHAAKVQHSNELIALYHDAYTIYVQTTDGPRTKEATSCRDAAWRHMGRDRQNAEFWTWIRPLVERLADREMWDDLLPLAVFEETIRQRADRAESLALWIHITRRLARPHGALFVETFPDPRVFEDLPEDQGRWETLRDRLLLRPNRLIVPSLGPFANRVDAMLGALLGRKWQQHGLTVNEFGSALERAATTGRTLSFYADYTDRKTDVGEHARKRWLVTKARQIATAPDDVQRAALQGQLGDKISAWKTSAASALG